MFKLKLKKLQAQKRPYHFSYRYGILKYRSKYGTSKLNLNRKAKDKNGKEIVCRHLAYYVYCVWERGIKDYHENLSSIENIEKQAILRNCEYDARDKRKDFCHKIFPLEEFGAALKSMASSLQIGNQQCLLFKTKSHLMTIAIRCKINHDGGKYYVIKFYNPNTTMVHQRIVCENLDVITKLTIKDFLSDKQINRHFSKYKCGAFFSPNSKKTNKQFAAKCNIRLKSDLQSSIYFNLRFGITDAVKELCHTILSSKKFNIKQKIQLLTAKDQNGTSAWCRALENGYTNIMVNMVNFFNAVAASSDLTSNQKLHLLVLKNHNGNSYLYRAFCCNDEVAVKKFCEIVLTSNLKPAEKIQLLTAKDQNGVLGFHMALQKYCADAVSGFCDVILRSDDLKPDDKIQLLATKDRNGVPGFYTALQISYQKDIIKAVYGYSFSKVILASSLDSDQKTPLLELMAKVTGLCYTVKPSVKCNFC
jgi:hypothetical protein